MSGTSMFRLIKRTANDRVAYGGKDSAATKYKNLLR